MTELSTDCGGIGDPPADGEAQITFVRDGRLHAVRADLSEGAAACLLDDVDAPVVWGPDAAKVLVDGRIVTATDDGSVEHPPGSSFTRPTGKSTVAVVDGGLRKTNVASGEQTDISFLARHDDVTYYPSGTHVIAAGEDGSGTDGIWLATNTGADPLLLAESPDTTFSHLSLTDDGTVIVFAADHGSETHVHRAQLFGEALATGADERDAETLLVTSDPIVSIALGDDGAVAVGHGTCESGGRSGTSLWPTEPLDDPDQPGATKPAFGWPIEFLPDGSLVYASSSEACFAPGEVFDLVLRRPNAAVADVPVVADVTAAAVRIAAGEPPPPPADNLSGFT